jgi:hypothetical protein
LPFVQYHIPIVSHLTPPGHNFPFDHPDQYWNLLDFLDRIENENLPMVLLEGITFPGTHRGRLEGGLSAMIGMAWFGKIDANLPLNVDGDEGRCEVLRGKIVFVGRFDGLVATVSLLALTYDGLDYCIPVGRSELGRKMRGNVVVVERMRMRMMIVVQDVAVGIGVDTYFDDVERYKVHLW